MRLASLCFVKKGDKILMINRNNPPFMGLWNAVGGKKEEGESIEECAIREIFEEGKILVKNVELLSVFTWNYDDDIGYAFVTELEDDFDISDYPKNVGEGIVDFKDINWVLNPKNYGVIEDLRVFLDDIKNNRKNNYHLVYKDSKLIQVIKK